MAYGAADDLGTIANAKRCPLCAKDIRFPPALRSASNENATRWPPSHARLRDYAAKEKGPAAFTAKPLSP